jgi:Na+-driven multidrug efflux pump
VLAGVGLGSISAGSFNWIFSFLSILTVPKVATAMARDIKSEACMHIAQAMWVALVAGLCTMTIVATAAPSFLASAVPSASALSAYGNPPTYSITSC